MIINSNNVSKVNNNNNNNNNSININNNNNNNNGNNDSNSHHDNDNANLLFIFHFYKFSLACGFVRVTQGVPIYGFGEVFLFILIEHNFFFLSISSSYSKKKIV